MVKEHAMGANAPRDAIVDFLQLLRGVYVDRSAASAMRWL
jgi:hypothetical protein